MTFENPIRFQTDRYSLIHTKFLTCYHKLIFIRYNITSCQNKLLQTLSDHKEIHGTRTSVPVPNLNHFTGVLREEAL